MYGSNPGGKLAGGKKISLSKDVRCLRMNFDISSNLENSTQTTKTVYGMDAKIYMGRNEEYNIALESMRRTNLGQTLFGTVGPN